MSYQRRIVGSEALFYAPDRLSPGVGAMRLYSQPNYLRRAIGWMRWWHWAGLAFAVLLLLDAKIL